MLPIPIPGFGDLQLEHLVLDYNGTLAHDGVLLDGVAERLNALAEHLQIHVITADTFGKAQENLADVTCTLSILPPGAQDAAKRHHVESLGTEHTIAIGNGHNDALMLEMAVVGIAVVQGECAAAATVMAADIVAPNILAALDLLANPLRLKATLRF